MAKTSAQLATVHRLEEIPEFASERQEAEFWDTHTMSDELWNSLPRLEGELPTPGTPMGVSLSLSAELAGRLRALASKKGVSYLALARAFVSEGLIGRQCDDQPLRGPGRETEA